MDSMNVVAAWGGVLAALGLMLLPPIFWLADRYVKTLERRVSLDEGAFKLMQAHVSDEQQAAETIKSAISKAIVFAGPKGKADN